MKASPLPLCLTACVLMAGGCSKWYTTNSDEAIARAWAPDNFYAAAPEATDHSVSDPGPATTSLDRTDWPVTEIIARSTQPQHQPIYTRTVRYDAGIPRNAGKYPTSATALDSVTTASTNAQVGEALVAPFAAAGDIVLFFTARVWQSGMWKTVDNGLEPYEREPGSSWARAARADLILKPAPSDAAGRGDGK